MQVKAADLRVGDKVIALDPTLGSFLREVVALCAAIDPPHDVTVTLEPVEGLGNEPVTVGAAHEITVVR